MSGSTLAVAPRLLFIFKWGRADWSVVTDVDLAHLGRRSG
jgi:hypothetical protein